MKSLIGGMLKGCVEIWDGSTAGIIADHTEAYLYSPFSARPLSRGCIRDEVPAAAAVVGPEIKDTPCTSPHNNYSRCNVYPCHIQCVRTFSVHSTHSLLTCNGLFSLLCILCCLLFCDIHCSLFLYCATLTEGFPCFFLSCKANARV
jgi:hypothetical protein